MSPEFSEGEMSVRAGTAAVPLKNYHLETLHVPEKRRIKDVPHRLPGNKALVSLNSDTHKRRVLGVLELCDG